MVALPYVLGLLKVREPQRCPGGAFIRQKCMPTT
jgi:hypothetical protein